MFQVQPKAQIADVVVIGSGAGGGPLASQLDRHRGLELDRRPHRGSAARRGPPTHRGRHHCRARGTIHYRAGVGEAAGDALALGLGFGLVLGVGVRPLGTIEGSGDSKSLGEGDGDGDGEGVGAALHSVPGR